nr:unnamed protein product [Callosobruchus chinensis]
MESPRSDRQLLLKSLPPLTLTTSNKLPTIIPPKCRPEDAKKSGFQKWGLQYSSVKDFETKVEISPGHFHHTSRFAMEVDFNYICYWIYSIHSWRFRGGPFASVSS